MREGTQSAEGHFVRAMHMMSNRDLTTNGMLHAKRVVHAAHGDFTGGVAITLDMDAVSQPSALGYCPCCLPLLTLISVEVPVPEDTEA